MNKKLEKYIHFNMTLIGGFMGGYALLNHCEIFSSAQTSNLIHLAMNIVGRNFSDFMLRIISLILYIMGLTCSVVVPKYTKLNLKRFSILVDIIAIIMIGCFKKTTNDYVALFPLFFAAPLQWNTFKGAEGYNSSCIFSTNNLRQFTTSFVEYLCDRDKSHLQKTKLYGGVLLFFHLGVGISYVASTSLGLKGAWICLIPAVTALSLVYIEDNFEKINKTRFINVEN